MVFLLLPMPWKILATALPENFSSLRLERKLLTSARIWFSQSNSLQKIWQKLFQRTHCSSNALYPNHPEFYTLNLSSSWMSSGWSVCSRSRLLSKYSERSFFSCRLRFTSRSSRQEVTLWKATLEIKIQKQPFMRKTVHFIINSAGGQTKVYLLNALKQALSW